MNTPMVTMTFDFNTPKLDFKVRQYKKRKIREMCFKAVTDWIFERGERPKIREDVYIVYYRSSYNPMDEDGVATSAKYWLDALTVKGIIEDDKPLSRGGHIQFIPVSHQGKPKTQIEVWSMGSPAEVRRMIKDGSKYRIRTEILMPET